MDARTRKISFGDFQTPESLAYKACQRLIEIGVRPDVIVEPTCGLGAFIIAAARCFTNASEVHGFEVNADYLDELRIRLVDEPDKRISLTNGDFFSTNWRSFIDSRKGSILVLGNFPWVTNAAQGVIGSSNLPEKSNFLGHSGFDSISGKANFDISEWMLLDVLRWLRGRNGDIAMLIKTAVARKVLAQAERQGDRIREATIIGIDAKREFGASVDACLLVIRLDASVTQPSYDYRVYLDLSDRVGRTVGHRDGAVVGDLETYEKHRALVGTSPQKWRSGVKHDASSIMELTRTPTGFINGLGTEVHLESAYIYPLMKGSDIGSNKSWRNKFIIEQFEQPVSAAKLRMAATITGCEVVDRSLAA